ncbi:MAG: hypothetical protein ACFB22_00990 [Rhodothalassiaceae bacterium]
MLERKLANPPAPHADPAGLLPAGPIQTPDVFAINTDGYPVAVDIFADPAENPLPPPYYSATPDGQLFEARVVGGDAVSLEPIPYFALDATGRLVQVDFPADGVVAPERPDAGPCLLHDPDEAMADPAILRPAVIIESPDYFAFDSEGRAVAVDVFAEPADNLLPPPYYSATNDGRLFEVTVLDGETVTLEPIHTFALGLDGRLVQVDFPAEDQFVFDPTRPCSDGDQEAEDIVTITDAGAPVSEDVAAPALSDMMALALAQNVLGFDIDLLSLEFGSF